jgi:hypothetical protein
MAKEINTKKIRNYNLIAGFFHLAQMVVVLVLSSDFTLPIVARYAAGPPGSDFAEPITLLDAPIGLTVAIFLGLSAFFHFLVASPQFFSRYAAGLAAHRNYFRWVEYSISSSVMIVLIALITGVSDVVAIICLFGVNASMILFGWLQEKYEERLHCRCHSLACARVLCSCYRRPRRYKSSCICLRHRLLNIPSL